MVQMANQLWACLPVFSAMTKNIPVTIITGASEGIGAELAPSTGYTLRR